MKNLSTPSLVLIAFTLGLGGGFFSGTWTHRHFSDQIDLDARIAEQTHNADVALRALKLLRAGSTNTVPFLEVELDDATVSIGRLVHQTPVAQRGVLELPMLAKIRDYRTTFPHKSEQPGLDEEIAHAFTFLDEKH